MEAINGSETSTLYSEIKNDSIDDQSWSIEVLQFEVPFLLAVIFIATIGNILVIVIYSKKALRKSNAALYVFNLAIGDLFAVGVAVFHVTEFYPSTWPILWRYNAQCILHRWCRYTAFNITVFLMVAIAVDRYYAVCQPIKFKTNCTLRRTKRIIGILWFLAILSTALQSYNFQVDDLSMITDGQARRY
ncbi:thyrotropin-releasing hormone receptor-like isoform X2 [Anneissia japonica]|uniref:thyrotropin-releasing hormone receptor-like isoform X2 n=1 Tax=Anneissia japonica TaxID=1529436 RepID=UPI0014255F6F|nr:thyrotropin-releasing hormone receptor-like isoform X2 [Anneissia japonica]